MAIDPNTTDAVSIPQLDDLVLEINSFLVGANADGKMGKFTAEQLANLIAPYVSAIGSSPFVANTGSPLPNPIEKPTAITFVGIGDFDQTTGANVVTTEELNVLFWSSPDGITGTWVIGVEIPVDLEEYLRKDEIAYKIGKNEADPARITIGGINGSGAYTGPLPPYDTLKCILGQPVVVGQIYSVSGFTASSGKNLVFRDNVGAIIGTVKAMTTSPYTTIAAPAGSVTCDYDIKEAADLDSSYANLQFEKGTATSFVAFKKIVSTIDGNQIEATQLTAGNNVPDPISNENAVNKGYLNTNALLKGQYAQVKSLSTTNGVSYACFNRYKTDISSLGDAFADKIRGDYFDAFKYLNLSGFDMTKPHSIAYVWADASQPANHYYRIAIKVFSDGAWSIIYDSGNIDKAVLGVVDGQTTLFDKTVSGRRVIALIDFNRVVQNSTAQISPIASEPECIISRHCFSEFNSVIVPSGGYVNAARVEYASNRKATFSFIFDDLNPTDALVYSIFREYGFFPNFALKTSNLNSGNKDEYINYWKEGSSILAHSITHPSMNNPLTITPEEVNTEMVGSKKAIQDVGIVCSGWVTPQSALSIDFLPIADRVFGYGFTTLNAGLFTTAVHPNRMNRFSIEGTDIAGNSLLTVTNKIDTAIANSQLINFYAHRLPSVTTDGDGTSYLTETKLRAILAHLKTKSDNFECYVMNTDDAVKTYYSETWAEKYV